MKGPLPWVFSSSRGVLSRVAGMVGPGNYAVRNLAVARKRPGLPEQYSALPKDEHRLRRLLLHVRWQVVTCIVGVHKGSIHNGHRL